jgi:hypothetical protein
MRCLHIQIEAMRRNISSWKRAAIRGVAESHPRLPSFPGNTPHYASTANDQYHSGQLLQDKHTVNKNTRSN